VKKYHFSDGIKDNSNVLFPNTQILSTMIFMLVICVTTNANYSNVPSFLQPVYIGFALMACGISYGSNGGYALNPVNDSTEQHGRANK
jgi:glycerol uptake facilitator-like aquaporin